MSRNRNGNKKVSGKRCSVHGGVIRGKVHYWNHQAMCKNCYRRFTVGGPNGGVKIVRGGSPKPKKGFFAKLFGG